MTRVKCDIWLAIDENGDYVVAGEHDTAIERFGDDIGYSGATMLHRLVVDVPLPVPRTSTVVLPEDAEGEVIVTTEEEGE